MADSRFFPGYFWCSDSPDCRLGLCMPGATAEEAVNRYLAGRRQYYFNRGKTATVYTMAAPEETPCQHDIVI
jgi:hypothetical protein